ncbi:hypothetical protein ACOSP7_006267 [Xanthoceras sorbifolium]
MATINIALVKQFLFVGFLCLSIVLTSVAGDRVEEILPGQDRLLGGPCQSQSECQETCKKLGAAKLFGYGDCLLRTPPGPIGDCWCRI